MRKNLKLSFSLMAFLSLSLTACSTSAPEAVYNPPGIELGDEIVNPPAPLPDGDAETFKTEVSDVVSLSCPEPTELSEEIVTVLNAPPSSVELKSGAKNGETITKAQEMPVETSYRGAFSYLIKAELSTGATAWFGSYGSLTDTDVLAQVKLDGSKEASIFGATEQTYDYFIWGENDGPGSAIVKEGEAVVELYDFCF